MRSAARHCTETHVGNLLETAAGQLFCSCCGNRGMLDQRRDDETGELTSDARAVNNANCVGCAPVWPAVSSNEANCGSAPSSSSGPCG